MICRHCRGSLFLSMYDCRCSRQLISVDTIYSAPAAIAFSILRFARLSLMGVKLLANMPP